LSWQTFYSVKNDDQQQVAYYGIIK